MFHNADVFFGTCPWCSINLFPSSPWRVSRRLFRTSSENLLRSKKLWSNLWTATPAFPVLHDYMASSLLFFNRCRRFMPSPQIPSACRETCNINYRVRFAHQYISTNKWEVHILLKIIISRYNCIIISIFYCKIAILPLSGPDTTPRDRHTDRARKRGHIAPPSSVREEAPRSTWHVEAALQENPRANSTAT